MQPNIDTTILDNIIIGRVEPYIYAFSTETVPNYLKVGDTSRSVRVRLEEWRKIFPNLIQQYEHTAQIDNDTIFRDFAVHTFLERERSRERLMPDTIQNLPYYSREFFKDATPEDVDAAVADIIQSALVGSGKYALYSSDHLPQTFTYKRTEDFQPRDNQQQAIDSFKVAVAAGRTNLLLYAVMRFGKSFTSMCCAREINARFVVVVSAKADVKEEWKKTVESHKYFDRYTFLNSDALVTNETIIADTLVDPNKKIVLFLTLQDLQGDIIKKKHKELFTHQIDLLIVDETHFGARGESYGKVLRQLKFNKTEIQNELQAVDGFETIDHVENAVKTLDAKIRLHLSGTPYRILMSDEFKKEDIIAFVQFTDIIDAQRQWDAEYLREDNRDEWENPYYGFPQMIRFAFNPNESSRKKMEHMRKEGITYAFSELFRPQSLAKTNENHRQFKNEAEILELLEVIDGSKEDDNLLGFLNYDKIKEGRMCRHMVCVLPFRASCDAMSALIQKNKDRFLNLGDYEIINIAGFDDETKYQTTEDVKQAIEKFENENKKTLTLTVNRMLTGTTVPQWDTMLYLKGTASPQEYDQAVFRLQNQYITTFKDEDSGKIIKYNMKPQTLLVDFDPNRMFVLQELKSQFYNVNTEVQGNTELKARIEKELEVSPIIVLNKNKLQQVTPSNITDAVREYSRTRSILEEATEIPVDYDLLHDNNLLAILQTIAPIDARNGLQIKPNEGEGDDIESPDENPNPTQGGSNTNEKPSATTPPATTPTEEINDLDKRLAAYYARILFFAFLTNSVVKSLSDIITQLAATADNRRISKNLGLSQSILKLIQAKSNPFVLRKFDYKIENTNDLGHDENLQPDERVKIAMRKFGRLSDSEVVTPQNVANEMVGLLPDDVFSHGVVLDIASKEGEFAMALLDRYGDGVSDKIYSVCTSKLAYEFTRKVYSLLSLPVNHIFEQFTSYDLIKKDQNDQYDIPKEIKDMNIAAVVGNPPYQEVVAQKETANGQKRSSSIFQHFQEISENSGRYTSLIYPGARWIHRSGKGMAQFGLDQINDPHLKLLKFFPDSTDVFKDVGIADGLSIVLKDSQKNTTGFNYIYSLKGGNTPMNADNPGEELFPLNPFSNQIVEQLDKFIEQYSCLHKSILSQKLFSIESDFVEKNTTLVREYNEGDTFDKTHEIKLLTNDKAGKSGRARWYVADRNVITSGLDQLNKWKVIVSSANAGGQKRSNQIAVIDNYSAFGRSRVALKTFDSEREAQNFLKYATSELIRFAFLLTDESLTSLAKKVPDIRNYKDDNGIIDFNQDIDAQLYELLNIGEADQVFIKKTLAEKAK